MIMMNPFSAISLNVAPRFVFLILYLVAAVTIPLIFNGWSVERSEPSWPAVALGTSAWSLNFATIIYYTVLPDLALRKLRSHGQQVLAEVIERRHRDSGTQLQLRFTNLVGSTITRDFFDLCLTGGEQERNQQLQLQRSGHQLVVPLWLNPGVKQPAFGFAYQTGWRSWPELRFGLLLMAVTMFSLLFPAVIAALRDPQLGHELGQLVLVTAAWPALPLVNLALLWMYFSHAAGPVGPTKLPVDLFHLAGVRAQTESFHWERRGYSGDLPLYTITVRYRDAAGQLQQTRFSATGRATTKAQEPEEEQELERMPQRRPILYLPQNERHILFRDEPDGMFL